MILLDTSALIWLDQGQRRAMPLLRGRRLHISPASLLELQFLEESGRLTLPKGDAQALAIDDRWTRCWSASVRGTPWNSESSL